MTKVIIRETIIALLVCLAVLLILSVVFYNYIPSNKVIPEAVEYIPTQEIKTQLNTEVQDNSNEILMTYEVTAQDLENFERTNDYNPGKANPFAPYSPTIENTNTENTSQNASTSNTSSPNVSNGGNSGGTLFEGDSSK